MAVAMTASEAVVAVEFQATASATAPAELRTTLAVTAAAGMVPAAASATAPAELRIFSWQQQQQQQL